MFLLGFILHIWLFTVVPLIHASSARQQPLRSQDAGQDRTVSASTFAELEELARIVDISYCVGATGTGIQKPFQCLSRCAEFDNFELVTTWNTGPLLSDSCGYIALSHAPNPERVIVAFRGTYSLANTVADLTAMPQEYIPYPGDDNATSVSTPPPKCENCTVHTGFYRSWQNTRSLITPYIEAALHEHPDYKLHLVGHSLGGAVAVFAGLDFSSRGFDPTITTFGEPRLGNRRLAEYIDSRFNLKNGTADLSQKKLRRITHVDDPVPQLPLEETGYMPHAGEVFISKYSLPPSVADVRYCDGDADPTCIEQTEQNSRGFIPARFKLWQILFSHRDYFWRLGLCVPSLSPILDELPNSQLNL